MDGCIQEKTFFMEKVKLLICSQKMNRALPQTNLIYYYKQKEKQNLNYKEKCQMCLWNKQECT